MLKLDDSAIPTPPPEAPKLSTTSIEPVNNSFNFPTITVNAQAYMKLSRLGKGGFSTVYRVLAPNKKFYALKRIKISTKQTIEEYRNEIILLSKLRTSKWIIHLYDYEINMEKGFIHMVIAKITYC